VRAVTRALIAALAATTGCRAHVQLTAPPAGAPEADRVAAYARLRPTEIGNEYGRHHTVVDEHVDLGDGTRVGFAADLEPVVLPSSQTAAYAARAADARTRRNRWAAAVIVLFGATVATGVVESQTIHDPWHVLGAEWGTLLVGGLLVYAASRPMSAASQEAFDAQAAAFDGYDADLRARLDVCVDGLRVVACDR
jgi:hypothetical protein